MPDAAAPLLVSQEFRKAKGTPATSGGVTRSGAIFGPMIPYILHQFHFVILLVPDSAHARTPFAPRRS